MIAVDTSALMAILLDEPQANACAAVLESDDRLIVSAGTVAECLIVARRRAVGEQMSQLIDGLGFEIAEVSPVRARQIADTYDRWGKGVHPAALNFGDCFAYALAEEHDCPLLYVGHDFAQTDLKSAISAPGVWPAK